MMRISKNESNRTTNYAAMIAWKGQGCLFCDEDDPRIIEGHHLKPEDKWFTLGSNGALNMDPFIYAAELEKCVPLCPTHHRKVELGIIEIPEEDERE